MDIASIQKEINEKSIKINKLREEIEYHEKVRDMILSLKEAVDDVHGSGDGMITQSYLEKTTLEVFINQMAVNNIRFRYEGPAEDIVAEEVSLGSSNG